jgi:hypothetical protein
MAVGAEGDLVHLCSWSIHIVLAHDGAKAKGPPRRKGEEGTVRVQR